MKKQAQQTVKKIFQTLKNILGLVQVVSFIYAFSCVLYWFLDLAQFPIAKSVSWLFEPVFSIVNIFYVSTTKVDFTDIITSLVFIAIAILAGVANNIVVAKEELFDIRVREEKRKDDIRAQIQVEQEYIAELRKYNRFIILVNITINQIKSYLVESNVDETELESLQRNLIIELFNQIKGNYILHKSMYENNGFYVLGNIEKTHECIKIITDSLLELSKKYSDMDISIAHDLSFDAISNKTDINEKLDFLKKVIQLNFKDGILTTSLFKTCYELISKTKMRFSELGNYQFLVKGKSNNYNLYSVKLVNTNTY